MSTIQVKNAPYKYYDCTQSFLRKAMNEQVKRH